jgi:dienelactone hydrolase
MRGGSWQASSFRHDPQEEDVAEILLFHHALGRTAGVLAFADDWRQSGHKVHTPDLYDGQVFETLDAGMAYAKTVGFDEIIARGAKAADELPAELVYAGFSLGVLPAQKLAQTRSGARGALLFHACIPPSAFETPWPSGLPVQIHAMDADPFFIDDGDLDAARALVASAEHAEFYLYPGNQHLFTDASLASFDAAATALLKQRVLQFLATGLR